MSLLGSIHCLLSFFIYNNPSRTLYGIFRLPISIYVDFVEGRSWYLLFGKKPMMSWDILMTYFYIWRFCRKAYDFHVSLFIYYLFIYLIFFWGWGGGGGGVGVGGGGELFRMVLFGNTENVYFLPDKQNICVFVSNFVLSVLISDVLITVLF